MRCILNARTLKRRLALVAAIAPRRTAKPILETIRLEVDDHGRATLTATDLESWVRAELPLLHGLRRGAVQLPREALRTILAGRGESELELDADPDAFGLVGAPGEPPCQVTIKGSGSRLNFRTYRPEEYPARASWAVPGRYTLGRKALLRVIRTTVFATDPRNTRYALGGCWFGAGVGELEVVATDGRRLAHALAQELRTVGEPLPPATHRPGDRSRVLAPVVGVRSLRALVGLLEKLKDGDPELSLAWTGDGSLQVEAPGLTFAARQLEGRFPDWRGSLPPPSPHRARFERPERLLDALRQAAALLGQDGRATRLELQPGVLTLTVAPADAGACRFEVPCAYGSKPARAEFTLSHLVEVLAVLQGEPVELELNGPDTPAVLHAAGLRYAVMPLPPKDEPGRAMESPPEVQADGRPDMGEEIAAPAGPASSG